MYTRIFKTKRNSEIVSLGNIWVCIIMIISCSPRPFFGKYTTCMWISYSAPIDPRMLRISVTFAIKSILQMFSFVYDQCAFIYYAIHIKFVVSVKRSLIISAPPLPTHTQVLYLGLLAKAWSSKKWIFSLYSDLHFSLYFLEI